MASITESALIVSSTEKSRIYLTSLLGEAGYSQIVCKPTVGEARRYLVDNEPDLCVLNAPLTDEFGERFAEDIAQKANMGVILCVKSDLYEEVTAKVEDYGVLTISKPIMRPLLWSAVKMAQSVHRRMQKMHVENQTLLQKIQDLRTIDKAKCLLISCLSLSEDEAHRYIEKRAMDSRQSKREVAEEILKVYDN